MKLIGYHQDNDRTELHVFEGMSSPPHSGNELRFVTVAFTNDFGVKPGVYVLEEPKKPKLPSSTESDRLASAISNLAAQVEIQTRKMK